MRHSVLILVLCSAPACAQNSSPQPACKLTFSVVQQDSLNNVRQGMRTEDIKWFKEKVQKKYPEVCYAEQGSSVSNRFFITITTGTYHGSKTVTESTPVTGTSHPQYDYDPAHARTVHGTATSSHQVDVSGDYPIFTLSFQQQETPDRWKVLHTFQRYCPVPSFRCHPAHDVIEDAAEWIHKGGMSDPSQSVKAENEQPQANAIAANSAPLTTVSIASTPGAADIEVDGKFVGNTPSAITLQNGEHSIKISKKGYKSWQRQLAVSGGSANINAELESEK